VGVHFVLVGDADGQRKPTFDKWQDSMNDNDIRESALIHELCGGLRLNLSTYRRGTDHGLFRFYTDLYDYADELPGSNLYSKIIREASLRYPTKQDCDCYFVVKHDDRILLNRLINLKKAELHAPRLYIPAPEDDSAKLYMKPQAMLVWPGMELICYSRKFVKNSPITGAVYIVQGWDSKTITVKLHPDYVYEPIEDLAEMVSDGEADSEDDVDEEDADVEDLKATEEIVYKLTIERAAQILRPQFALCYASIQGRTFREKHIGLLDLESRALTMRDIITATSRPTHGEYLHFISYEHRNTLFSEARGVNDTDLRLAM
jgi:hypothetical protein